MENILDVAQYIFDEYKKMSDEIIDEMKLHKLLYFSQRESIAITGEPLFAEEFSGWKFGPVSLRVRTYYTADGIATQTKDVSDDAAYILKNVLLEYGSIASWKLSKMSHKELSWQNARVGLAPNENGSKLLLLDDIRKDAEKIRPYDHVWDMYYDEFDDLDLTEEEGV